MMTTRVRRRRRPRVPPRKRRQPLPQYGGLFGQFPDTLDRNILRGFKGLFTLTNTLRKRREQQLQKRQKGGRINAYIKRRTSR